MAKALLKTASSAAINAARLAKEAGMPRDQLVNFWKANHTPLPKQMVFHAACREADKPNGPTSIGFGGARGGGKSRATLAQLALDDCQRVPGLKALFLRKVGKAARESFEDLRRQTLMNIPHNYRAHVGQLEFENDSRIVLGHFRNEGDIDAYLGIEYDVIVIEEATQLSPQKKRDIATCCRTSKTNWRPRIYQTTNPGGVDHKGFRDTFIKPFREHTETETRFIPATVRDNPFVNKEYKATLESLVGWKRKAWLDGDWDIAVGQFFSHWRNDHCVVEPFEIPSHWTMWGAMDYGFTHPTVFLLLAENDGITYVVSEHSKSKWLVPQHAEAIIEACRRQGREVHHLWRIVAGADAFAQKGDRDAKTVAEQYKEAGIKLEPAPMDRISGWAEILKKIGNRDDGVEPTLQIFSTCTQLIETIPALIHDEHRVEDVEKVDVDEDGKGGDDTADALRYGIMARLRQRQTPAPSSSYSFFNSR
jgi:hypothetical protein